MSPTERSVPLIIHDGVSFAGAASARGHKAQDANRPVVLRIIAAVRNSSTRTRTYYTAAAYSQR